MTGNLKWWQKTIVYEVTAMTEKAKNELNTNLYIRTEE